MWARLPADSRSRIAVGYHLGRVRVAEGRHEDAREVFEAALASAQTHKVPPDRTARIRDALAKLPPGSDPDTVSG